MHLSDTNPKRIEIIRKELERVDGQSPNSAAPIGKHLKMARSPLQFYRGSAQLFFADLANGDLELPIEFLEPPLTRIMGDCHFSNFGFYTEDGSYGEQVVWAPNDYDDAAEAHAAFDLSRFSTSLFLVAEYLNGVREGRYETEEKTPEISQGISGKDAAKAAKAFLKSYSETCKSIIWDPHEQDRAVDCFPKKHFLTPFLEKAIARAPYGDKFLEKSVVGKMTVATDAGFRFDLSTGKIEHLDPDLAEELEYEFRPHLDDEILDLGRRLGAGTGALNVDRYYFLVGPGSCPEEFAVMGESEREALLLETHIVEAKQQREASLIHHFPDLSPVNRMNPAHLTVDCQRHMTHRPDLILDEVVWRGEHWLVRSRHHARVNVDPEKLLFAKNPAKALKDYAASCGDALARTHSRGDHRSARFEEAIVEAIETSGKDFVKTTEEYAYTVIRDHAILRELIDRTIQQDAA